MQHPSFGFVWCLLPPDSCRLCTFGRVVTEGRHVSVPPVARSVRIDKFEWDHPGDGVCQVSPLWLEPHTWSLASHAWEGAVGCMDASLLGQGTMPAGTDALLLLALCVSSLSPVVMALSGPCYSPTASVWASEILGYSVSYHCHYLL